MTNHTPQSPNNDISKTHEEPISAAQIEALLNDGDANLYGTLLWGSNYAALVTISNETLQTLAVYKPQHGERPLWDFPNGTLCYREVVAYLVSEALGWHLVPPTVLRHGPHGLGSVQLFIEHNPEINYFVLDDHFTEQVQRFAVFDYLINNADRKGGHLLLDAQGKLWGIDHGLSFHPTPKLRTVIWEFAGQQIDDTLLQDIQRFCEKVESKEDKHIRSISTLLRATELEALMQRARQLLKHKQYSTPNSGPNYPWPPV